MRASSGGQRGSFGLGMVGGWLGAVGGLFDVVGLVDRDTLGVVPVGGGLYDGLGNALDGDHGLDDAVSGRFVARGYYRGEVLFVLRRDCGDQFVVGAACVVAGE